jgi:hypothetical protein
VQLEEESADSAPFEGMDDIEIDTFDDWDGWDMSGSVIVSPPDEERIPSS